VTPPSRATAAGRAYLDIRKRALAEGRPVDELFHLLARRHPLDGTQLSQSIRRVALDRGIELMPLSQVLVGYGDTGQRQWEAWRRRQSLEDRLPALLADVLMAVARFTDPAITGTATGQSWVPEASHWAATALA
jgi:hypothetical protein